MRIFFLLSSAFGPRFFQTFRIAFLAILALMLSAFVLPR
jgi:hypothetical protein